MENTILNFSKVEDDPFAKVSLDTQNVTANEAFSNWHPTTAQIILEIVFVGIGLIKFLFGIAAVLADILLIHLILRYKRLRKNFNMYILHYAIANCCYHLVSPIFLLIHALFATGYVYFIYIYCYLGMMEQIFLLMSLVFILLLGLHWIISSFKPHFIVKFRIFFNNKFVILYAIFTILIVASFIDCSLGFSIGSIILDYAMFFMTIILTGIIYYRHLKVLDTDHLKTEYALWISAIVLGSILPIFILDLVFRVISDFSYPTISIILFIVEYIASLVSTPAPVYVLWYLNKWNKYFKMAFDTTFRKSVQSYGADNLDEASDNEDIVSDNADKNGQINSETLNNHTVMVP